MTVPVKLALFAAVLALLFAAGLLVGDLVGPIDTGSTTPMNHGAS